MSTLRPDEGEDFDITIDGEWRKASREEPQPHVDATILAAARARRPRFATWQPLAAAASVAGLAFLLVQLLPRERELEPPIRIESQQPVAAPAEPRTRENESPQRVHVAPKSSVAPPQAPAEAAASRSDVALEPRQSSSESRVDAELGVGAAAPAEAAERAAARAESSSLAAPTVAMPPAQWATLIETLHASGDLAAAAAQLRAFRMRQPDADRYLPEALREWASAVE